jgi:hypothetical protein
MKICSYCNKEKLETEFYFRNKQKQELHSHCKVCYAQKRKSYGKEHYQKYREQYKRRARARKIIVGTQLKATLLAYLRNKQCIDCGISDVRVLDFDHREPEQKTFSVARALSNGVSWERILMEIEKCTIRCSNCHRIRTAEQFGWYRR